MAELVKKTEYDHHEEVLVPQRIESSIIGTLAKAELDVALLIAQQRPRNIDNVKLRIEKLATLDQETAEECIYALPRGGKPIKGASIRLAEIIHTSFQNCGVASRVVDIDRENKIVIAEGIFHDYETNVKTRREIQRRISDARGRLYSDDMIITTGNAAAAIAQRNAILAGVPHGIWRQAEKACLQILAGDVTTLIERRTKAMKAFAAFGVTPDQIVASLGLKSIDDITQDHMETLLAMHSALKNNEETVESMFDSRRTAGGGFAAVNNPLADIPKEKLLPEQPVTKPSQPVADSSAGTNQETVDGKKLNDAFRAGQRAAQQGVKEGDFEWGGDGDSDEAKCWLDGYNSVGS